MKVNICKKLLAVFICVFMLCSCSKAVDSVINDDILIESLESEADFEFITEAAADFSVPQIIEADNPALEYINSAEGNPYKVSLEITADGIAEENLYAAESGYSYTISQNEAVLGLVPEFYLLGEINVSDVTVKFTLDDGAALGSIDKYMIFMWFEDTNTLLPVETFYDSGSNSIYANTDRLGTYCVIDTWKWLGALSEKAGYASAPNEPGNIIFCIDPRCTEDDAVFDSVKNDIQEVFQDACSRYENIKLYVYYQQNVNGNIIHTLLEDTANGRDHFTTEDFPSPAGAVYYLEKDMIECDTLTYDFAAATKFMLEVCDENVIAMYHIVYDGNVLLSDTSAEELSELISQSKYLKRDGELMDRIYVNTLCISEYDIIPESSNFHKLAEASNGMVYCEASETEENENE